MNAKVLLPFLGAVTLAAVGCSKEKPPDPAAEKPPAAQVQQVGDDADVRIEHPEQFPLVEAARYESASEINATGVVAADVSRAVPVISLASGRVLEVHAKLGDTVTKGQLLMRVQSTDISGANSDYRQAVADHALAKSQLERAKVLLDKGAVAQKDYDVAVSTEVKAAVTVETARERLRILGADPDHPSAIVDINAPISGIITDQQTNTAAGVQGLASPNPFTISDLSTVWVICDVYENDLKNVRQGDIATVRLDAYPDRTLQARISNIGPTLDPATRAAKVRLEMKNPGGFMRVGMFVTATFHGTDRKVYATVPANAVLHLHDRDWVYQPAGNSAFRRVEVV
ncbi:MAG: efflux RND transporter periplasmic adaptor subunit, partial [Terriglobia bacterium]